MDSKGKKISLILITGIMTVLPLVGRTADSGNLLFLAMLVAISAVMLCNNVFKRNISLSFNLTDIAVLFFCIYVFIMLCYCCVCLCCVGRSAPGYVLHYGCCQMFYILHILQE